LLALDDTGAPILADTDDVIGSPPVLAPLQENVNEAESWYARAALLWKATDAVDFLLWWHHQDEDVGDRQAHNPDFEGDGFFRANAEYQQSINIHEPYTRDADLVSLEATVEFGFATLTSATAWGDNAATQTYDVTGCAQQFLMANYYFFPRFTAPTAETADSTGLIQEFRLASRGDETLDWVVGAFYQDTTDDFYSVSYVPGIEEYYSALLGFDPGTDDGLVIDRRLESEDFAVFGELTWHVTDAWQVTGGVRAFWGSFDQDFVQLLPLCGAPCANDGLDPLGTTAASSSVSYDDRVFKLNTSYDFTDDLTGYFTWAEGYRHAGANALPTAGIFAEDPSLLSFGPDSASNFEVGLKGTIADRVQFSTAAFYITWEDFQFDTFAPVSLFQFVGNANEARSQGVELELAARITDGLTATVGYSYTDAELTEDFAVSSVQGFEGDEMPGVPEHSLSWTADYVHPVSGDYSLRFHVNGMYRSDTQSDWNTVTGFGRRYFPMDSFSLWDLSLSLLAGDRWSATAFVDNVGNEEGTTGGIPAANYSPRGAYFMVVRPLTFGLRLGYSWGK
jgi:outer membrane receptor protein involved in Fe transport